MSTDEAQDQSDRMWADHTGDADHRHTVPATQLQALKRALSIVESLAADMDSQTERIHRRKLKNYVVRLRLAEGHIRDAHSAEVHLQSALDARDNIGS